MSSTRCKKCHEFIDTKDVICVNCGTHQASGMHISKLHKKQESDQKRQKSRFVWQMLCLAVGAVFFSVAIVAGIHGYFYLQRTNNLSSAKADKPDTLPTPASATTAAPVQKSTIAKSMVRDDKPETPPAPVAVNVPDAMEKTSAPDDGLSNFSGNLNARKELKLPLQPAIAAVPGYNLGRTNIVPVVPGKKSFSFSFASPNKVGDKLRLIVYRADLMQSVFTQIADLNAVVIENPLFAPRTQALPQYVTAEMKKHIEEMRKEREKVLGKNVANFSFSDNVLDKNVCYFMALCKPDGSVLFSHSFLSSAAVALTKNMTMGMNGPGQEIARLAYGAQDAIFPDFSDRRKCLMMRFSDPKMCRVESLKLDGIEYPPVVVDTNEYRRRDLVTGKEQVFKQRALELKYPFAGQVEVRLKVGEETVVLKFALPPTVPRCSVKMEGGYPTVRWNAIKDLNPADYVRLPQLAVNGSRGLVGKYSLKDDPQSFVDLSSSPNAHYSVTLTDGIIKTVYWTKETGVKSAELALKNLRNPYQETGIRFETAVNESRPLRIALLQSDICFENTGINGRRLLATVTDKLIADPGMELLDQESRKYVLEQKRFKMSESLRAAFPQDAADFSVYIRDYSRQDGNGIELWLNKTGQNNRLWWRIADINNKAEDVDTHLVIAAEALRAKITELRDITPAQQRIAHMVSPETIIMMPLRPLNQAQVVTEFAAISESIMLKLSDNNDKIKIVSENDWKTALDERLKNGSNGGGYDFINKINDLLVSGWVWQEQGQKKYIFKACDVFSGEVLGVKTFSGKINDVSTVLGEWLTGLKLAERKVVPKDNKKINYGSYDWIHNRGLKQYGEFIRYDRESDNRNAGYDQSKADVYAMAVKNWNDGYKDKAIALIEPEWKAKKNTRSGSILISYYSAVGRNEEALALCKILMEREDCPEWVVGSYNHLRKIGKTGGVKPREKEVAKDENMVSELHLSEETERKMKTLDYNGVHFVYKNGKRLEELIPRRVDFEAGKDIAPLLFADRETIGAEWGPGAPCINNRQAFNVGGNLLSEGVLNPEIKSRGVYMAAFLLRYPIGAPLEEHFMEAVRLKRGGRNHSRNSSDGWSEERKSREFPRTVAVISYGWNSVNPFDKFLSHDTQYVRLAYFFKAYKYLRTSVALSPYDVSYVRAIMELSKSPDLKMPPFYYYSDEDDKVQKADLSTAADVINSFINELHDGFNDKLLDMKFTHFLAIEFMAKRGDARAQKFYRMIMNTKIPQNMEEYCNGGVSEEFLVYMAGRKNKKAKEMLLTYWDNGAPHYENAADYLYYIANSGDVELTAYIAKKMSSSRGTKVLRWASPQVLHSLLTDYRSSLNNDTFHYLTLGRGDKDAAKATFMNSTRYDDDEFLIQFYGKPVAEAADDLYREHQVMRDAIAKKVQKP